MQLVRLTRLLLIVGVFALCVAHAFAEPETDGSSTETNEIIPREAIQKLDISVRQALLRAIDKLEQEELAEAERDDDNTDQESTSVPPSTVSSQAQPIVEPHAKDEILEESTNAADVVPTVQFFTATFDERNAQEQLLSSFIDRSKIWKKGSGSKNLGSPVVVAETSATPSPDNRQAARSVQSARANEISGGVSDEIKFEIRKSKPTTTTTTTTSTPRPTTTTTTRRRPTTTTTTTTTTPRPTHNEDGENIEVVDKDDIRILEAPLVTAFTVDLDERGSAKNVVPIVHSSQSPKTSANLLQYQTRAGPTIAKLNVLPAGPSQGSLATFPTQASPTSTTTASTANRPFGNYITKEPLRSVLPLRNSLDDPTVAPSTTSTDVSDNVNNYLIERQRQLEQQIYQLKLQAQQQQELILRQLKLLEEQTKFNGAARNTGTSNIQQIPQQQQQQQQQLQKSQDPGYTIRPSIEYIQKSSTTTTTLFPTFPVDQQLPLKDTTNKFNVNGNFGIFQSQQQQQQLQQQQQQQQQQQRPLNNPVHQVFQNLQKLQSPNNALTGSAPSSSNTVQIQPSTQFNFLPTFSPPTVQQPFEVSLFQQLPQHQPQQFQTTLPPLPSFLNNAVRNQQQQQPQHSNQGNVRLFRQESDTSNFGVNQVQIQPSTSFASLIPASVTQHQQQQQQQQQFQQQNLINQNFYRQNLDPQLSNQLQQNAEQYYQQQQQQLPNSALNHGITNFAPAPPSPLNTLPTQSQQQQRFNAGRF